MFQTEAMEGLNMLMLGFWASKNVPIRKFRVAYPNGAIVNPKFKKFLQPKGDVTFKFEKPVRFYKGCTFSWESSSPFKAEVSPVFEPETDFERKILQVDKYQFRLLQFKKEVE